MNLATKRKLKSIFICIVLMAFGLLALKFLPMRLFGNDILFDASMHIVVASFILYVLWFFIDQNKNWEVPYFIFSLVVLLIIGIQRILVNAHNDLGLLMGIVIAIISIVVSRGHYFMNKISF